MKTYNSTNGGMFICKNNTGEYVKRADAMELLNEVKQTLSDGKITPNLEKAYAEFTQEMIIEPMHDNTAAPEEEATESAENAE
jgi:hypothetical protein